jgi:hypothetical protein
MMQIPEFQSSVNMGLGMLGAEDDLMMPLFEMPVFKK